MSICLYIEVLLFITSSSLHSIPLSFLKTHFISQTTNILDFNFHNIVILQECLWLHESCNSAWSSSHDDSALSECGAPAEMLDKVR